MQRINILCGVHVCTRCATRRTFTGSRRRAFSISHIGQQQSVLGVLEERGLINQIAGDRHALDHLLRSRKVGFYAGIDPTAPSLHLGHLLPLIPLFWLYHHGHHVVSLVGGATAKVGDPSGRLTSRAKTAAAVTDANFEAMFAQLGKLWRNVLECGERHQAVKKSMGEVELLNNAAWLDSLNILQFLRMMGTGMRLGTMLGRDTVRNKMEKGDGMSFSEFTYPLLQAWDWWQMYHDRGVQVQIGGSDQYGNIIAGIDGVKYIAQSYAEAGDREWLDAEGRLKDELSPMGLTVPLLTTSSGEKFGKSAGNAVWLDPNLTSPFDLYGFLLRSADDDVERYLKLFTFLSLSDISKIMVKHIADPGKRKAQHLLACEVIELVHGREEAQRTQMKHQASRDPSMMNFDTAAKQDLEADDATSRIRLPRSLIDKTPFARILYHAGLVPSKSEGARLISKGGVYVHKAGSADWTPVKSQEVTDIEKHMNKGAVIIRLGKWKVRMIEVLEDSDYEATGQEAPGWTDYKAAKGR